MRFDILLLEIALRSASILFIFTLSACAHWDPKRGPTPEEITDLHIQCSGQCIAIPGVAMPVVIEARDSRGGLFSTTNKDLDPQLVGIGASSDIRYDGDGQPRLTVNPELKGEPQEIQFGLYWAKTNRRFIERLKLDWWGVSGPPTTRIRDLSVGLENVIQRADGKIAAAPGDVVRLQVIVTDDQGREYAAGSSSPSFPWSRLYVVHDKNLALATAGGELRIPADVSLHGVDVEFAVGIGRELSLRKRGRIAVDKLLLVGPLPDEATGLHASLQSGRLEPSTTYPFVLNATDNRGYRYELNARRGRLDHSLIEVASSTGLSFDLEKAVIRTASASESQSGGYAATLRFKGTNVETTIQAGVDLSAPLRALAIRERSFSFVGDLGMFGRSGATGQPPGGVWSGGSGGRGGDGQQGGAGGRGPDVLVAVIPVMSFDKADRFNAFVIDVGGRRRFFVLPVGERITVTSTGGPGGTGGFGGAGGSGSNGKPGIGNERGGDSGSGGPGGNGGRGGTGGAGGRVRIIGFDVESTAAVTGVSRGGEGGEAGEAGQGGSAGMPGNGGSYTQYQTINNVKIPMMQIAPSGSQGTDGYAGSFGAPGVSGSDGSTSVSVSPAEALSALRSASPQLTSVAALPAAPATEEPSRQLSSPRDNPEQSTAAEQLSSPNSTDDGLVSAKGSSHRPTAMTNGENCAETCKSRQTRSRFFMNCQRGGVQRDCYCSAVDLVQCMVDIGCYREAGAPTEVDRAQLRSLIQTNNTNACELGRCCQ